MKIEININEDIEDIEIVFSCRKLTPAVERMLATLMVMDKKLTVIKEDETYFLDVAKVIYLESVDRKTFVYTEDAVYESRLKLYELEQQLDEYGFFRANKSCLIQLKYVRSLKADINRKIKVTLENGEQVMVSRQYAEGLKKKLGVK
ncbi:putative HTH-type transcriptional regulator [Lachnospiraceae bacterium]|nr:LytTR family transcriptional regulator [Lachnospiraceae bacterium]GFI18041.1 putative HTH-type transcriptional regulator [Lachnospiraceae bacterium]GFI69708.1 putative HTH-type transcriptional regulator [Lachnospiraceae bacterium]